MRQVLVKHVFGPRLISVNSYVAVVTRQNTIKQNTNTARYRRIATVSVICAKKLFVIGKENIIDNASVVEWPLHHPFKMRNAGSNPAACTTYRIGGSNPLGGTKEE